MVNRKVAVLRADASSSIGVGHIMRSLSLGEALIDEGFGVELVSFELAPNLQTLATSLGIHVVELSCAPRSIEDAHFVLQRNAQIIVVDGYEFSRDFFEVLETNNAAFVVIDDNSETNAQAPKAVINQNPHASKDMYRHMHGDPKLLLGLQYAMVRKEVREIAAQQLPTNEGEVFVAMGGADFLGLTAPIVEALAEQSFHVRVAVGHTNSQRAAVQQLVDRYAHVTLIDQHDYVSSLACAQVAVLAAGSSLWEACAVETPSIGLIVADNQAGSSAAAAGLGFTHVIDCRNGLPAEDIVSAVRMVMKEKTEAMRDAARQCRVRDGVVQVARSLGALV